MVMMAGLLGDKGGIVVTQEEFAFEEQNTFKKVRNSSQKHLRLRLLRSGCLNNVCHLLNPRLSKTKTKLIQQVSIGCLLY